MNCPEFYSNTFGVKQPFSKFFSSGKSRESVEDRKTGSVEVQNSFVSFDNRL